MANLRNQLLATNRKIRQASRHKKLSNKELREYLGIAVTLARRVEASRVVMGFFGGSLTGIIDDVLRIATPLVAISGDFELSNLLGSLKVWLDKKKAQEAQEQAQRDTMFSQTADDLTFNYGY